MKLEPPRWPGGPAICPHANLPYFETELAFRNFEKSMSQEGRSLEGLLVRCSACGGWHHLTGSQENLYRNSRRQ